MAVHPRKEPLQLGDHGLITGYSGKANWDELLKSELKTRAGKLLVTGKVPRRFPLPFAATFTLCAIWNHPRSANR
jgi:hypothetical protein